MDHKGYAITCFNATWDLLDNLDRSSEDEAKMIHLAHTSLHHWNACGSRVNNARGEWLIAHVYYTLGHKESALYHAKRCIAITLENRLEDFDLTFGYEIMAKVLKLHQDMTYKDYVTLAYDSLNQIKKEGDKTYAKSQIDAI